MSGNDASIPGEEWEVVSNSLLDLALSRPEECRRQAHALIARLPVSMQPSAVWQALGLAHRQSGDIATALRHLRRAVGIADGREDRRRQADARASLAATLALAGRSKQALAIFDKVIATADGITAARAEMRRGAVLWLLGRHEEALEGFRRCLPVLRRHKDQIWEARALMARAAILLDRGASGRADADLTRAAVLLQMAKQDVGSARAVQNRGWARYRAGDIPTALELLTSASHRFVAATAVEPSVEIDLCTTLLAAGLTDDAVAHARRALELARASGLAGAHRADVELTLADATLLANDVDACRRHAADARRLYETQSRIRGARLAALLVARARWSGGERSVRFLAQVVRLADELAALRAYEAGTAQLLAGRIASAVGRTEIADQRLALAAAQRRRGSALMRATGWLAQALRADAAGSSRAVFSAARAGLRVLDEHRLSLGATEMRAAATAHGGELAALAVRHAARRGSRDLLTWSERWRATTLSLPPVRPPKNRQLTADLGRLREVTRKASEARAGGSSTEALDRERRRLEETVRSRSLTTPGDGSRPLDRLDTRELLAALSDHALVSIVDIDGKLQVLVAEAGRVRRFRAGRTADAAREVDFARFALRAAAGTGPARAGAALPRVEAAGERLQAILLGNAVRAIGDRPLVVVPPAKLHATPWAVLPALRERAFTVAPSAASWLRARRRRPPRRRDVVLVAGPDLGSRGAEISALERTYDDAAVFTGSDAACLPVLKALDGAWLAHVAAHGVLRPDNPLFSALTLHDGPLTVYDLEQLRRAPYRLILSACESGIGATAGADEVLGLAGALISLGTAGMAGSVVVVDDAAAARISLVVHGQLAAGDDLAHALLAARTASADNPVDHAAALAFLALGAA